MNANRCLYRLAAGAHQATLEGENRRLGAVAQTELDEDPAHVRLDSLLCDDEVSRDLGIGQTLGDQSEDLGLTLRELIEPLHAGLAGRTHPRELRDEPLRDGRREQCLTR